MEKANDWARQALGYSFKSTEHLLRALTHRSAGRADNERYEFLGDSVLQLTITELIFEQFEDAPEGRMSRLRSSLVRDSALAEIAAELGVGQHIALGSGEKKSGGHRRNSILADAMEALFAAVYLDSGIVEAKRVILHVYGKRIEKLPDQDVELRDPKTRLQEWLQARKLPLPNYVMNEVSGKAHKQLFKVSCQTDAIDKITAGSGQSRRAAEQAAAEAMLLALNAEG